MSRFQKSEGTKTAGTQTVSQGQSRSRADSFYMSGARATYGLQYALVAKEISKSADSLGAAIVDQARKRQNHIDQMAALDVSSMMSDKEAQIMMQERENRMQNFYSDSGETPDAETRFNSYNESGYKGTDGKSVRYDMEFEAKLANVSGKMADRLRHTWDANNRKILNKMEVYESEQRELAFEKKSKAFLDNSLDKVEQMPSDENISLHLALVEENVFQAFEERGYPKGMVNVEREKFKESLYKTAAETRYNETVEDVLAAQTPEGVKALVDRVGSWLSSPEVSKTLDAKVITGYRAKLAKLVKTAKKNQETQGKKYLKQALSEQTTVISSVFSEIGIFSKENKVESEGIAEGIFGTGGMTRQTNAADIEKLVDKGFQAIETKAALMELNGDTPEGIKAWRESQIKKLNYEYEFAKGQSQYVDPRNPRGK